MSSISPTFSLSRASSKKRVTMALFCSTVICPSFKFIISKLKKFLTPFLFRHVPLSHGPIVRRRSRTRRLNPSHLDQAISWSSCPPPDYTKYFIAQTGYGKNTQGAIDSPSLRVVKNLPAERNKDRMSLWSHPVQFSLALQIDVPILDPLYPQREYGHPRRELRRPMLVHWAMQITWHGPETQERSR